MNDVVYDPSLAIDFANKNHDDVKKSKNVGCFRCLAIIPAKEVVAFLHDGDALCPMCGDKTIIPDVSMPVTGKNLTDIYNHYRKRRL